MSISGVRSGDYRHVTKLVITQKDVDEYGAIHLPEPIPDVNRVDIQKLQILNNIKNVSELLANNVVRFILTHEATPGTHTIVMDETITFPDGHYGLPLPGNDETFVITSGEENYYKSLKDLLNIKLGSVVVPGGGSVAVSKIELRVLNLDGAITLTPTGVIQTGDYKLYATPGDFPFLGRKQQTVSLSTGLSFTGCLLGQWTAAFGLSDSVPSEMAHIFRNEYISVGLDFVNNYTLLMEPQNRRTRQVLIFPTLGIPPGWMEKNYHITTNCPVTSVGSIRHFIVDLKTANGSDILKKTNWIMELNFFTTFKK